ncbi:hypothetical protein PRAG_00072 [Prochlorococcus phage P-SSM3]|uniref:Uncharacterized protein n=1 Tax=Prochlorococcus phage P-SSM3 TaxID=536453 RepID=R9S7L3_9CAUD|nr:hypothetical protein PRAG_00072 [Prochlorococcus phage P-SSM3]AGN12014.1 hypothetical protein PRAG_00072 [Prochlorococcus phage P-SSM3]
MLSFKTYLEEKNLRFLSILRRMNSKRKRIMVKTATV